MQLLFLKVILKTYLSLTIQQLKKTLLEKLLKITFPSNHRSPMNPGPQGTCQAPHFLITFFRRLS